MADKPHDQTEVNIDELSKYVIMGIHRDTGKYVVAASPGCDVHDMGMFHGRLAVDIQGHIINGAVGIILKGNKKSRIIS